MIPKHLQEYHPKYFDKGHRSVIYIFTKNNKKYIIKLKNPKSEAINRLENETNYLRILNRYHIGPRLIESGKDYIVYEFIDGQFFVDYIKEHMNIKSIINEILNQCRILDKLKINKKEMHHPIKHIIIKNKKPIMLDFERCYQTEKPKNVSQFITFLLRQKLIKINSIKEILKEYKKSNSDKDFKIILNKIYLKEGYNQPYFLKKFLV